MTIKENQLTQDQYNLCTKTYKSFKIYIEIKNNTRLICDTIYNYSTPKEFENNCDQFCINLNENVERCYKVLKNDLNFLRYEIASINNYKVNLKTLNDLYNYLFQVGIFNKEDETFITLKDNEWTMIINTPVEDCRIKIANQIYKNNK